MKRYVLIGNSNVFIRDFDTIEKAKEYVDAQDMVGDEVKYDGVGFISSELIDMENKESTTQGVDWYNLKSFADYKKEQEKKYKECLAGHKKTFLFEDWFNK